MEATRLGWWGYYYSYFSSTPNNSKLLTLQADENLQPSGIRNDLMRPGRSREREQ